MPESSYPWEVFYDHQTAMELEDEKYKFGRAIMFNPVGQMRPLNETLYLNDSK